jgi:hypothetical protein
MTTTAGLGSAMREEVWAIVRAAVEEAVGPLAARNRELEARVERAERNVADVRSRSAPPAPLPATQTQSGGSAASKLASIPVAFGPSLGPSPTPAVRTVQIEQPPASVTNPGGVTIPDLKAAAPYHSGRTHSAHPVGPRPSGAPTGFGVAVVTAPRASLDLQNVGPIDVEGFDGGARKKRVAGVVALVMLFIVAAAVTMSVLSHN